MELLDHLILHYGYVAVFTVLALGIAGLPIPDEIVVFWIGYFTQVGSLDYIVSIIVCFVGSFTGMLISYLIGHKAGRPLIERFGKWFGLTEKRIHKTETWMQKYGPHSIIISYFIPGIRHVTCYLCGMSRMRLKTYISYVGISAFVWCIVFVSIGHFFSWLV